MSIAIPSFITVYDLSKLLNVKALQIMNIIKDAFNVDVTLNQQIPFILADYVAMKFNVSCYLDCRTVEQKRARILTASEAEHVYNAMCAMNNIWARISVYLSDGRKVEENGHGEIVVVHSVHNWFCETYVNQAAFCEAYELNKQ